MLPLQILRPPASMRSGDDVLGPKTIAGLTAAGIPTTYQELWPAWWAEHLWHSKLPGRRTLFEFGPARWGLRSAASACKMAGAIWINGPASPLDESGDFERQMIARGKPFVFHLQDDWFQQPKLGAVAGARVRIASLIVVPTEPLRDRIRSLFPAARLLVLEEPIDTDRMKPVPGDRKSANPLIVWSGHFNSQPELMSALEALDRAFRKMPFTLRILSRKPANAPAFSFPVEWFPYDPAREAELMSGAIAGIAPLPDTPYARCKGGYKVKTYCAAGVPPVASPVGHHTRLIEPGVNGLLATTTNEWEEALLNLLRDPDAAREMGKAARRAAVEKYSHEALMPQWASALRQEIRW